MALKRKRRAPRRVPSPRKVPAGQAQPSLLYKVVELSSVDESALEATINRWVPRGWTLDGVQFAMRESSKRPAMAFVFFTRGGPEAVEVDAEPEAEPQRYRSMAAAQAHLDRVMREEIDPTTTTVHDAWQRLKELAGEDEPGNGA